MMNIKKHTKIKQVTSFILLCALVAFSFGCDPKEIPKAIIPPPPKQVQSSIPKIDKVDSGIGDSLQTNQKIGDKILENKQTVKEQDILIADALLQAEKIKEKITAKLQVSEIETTNLVDQLKKIKSRNLFLELQNTELSKLKNDQEKILQNLRTDLSLAKSQIVEKENEAILLRDQNKYLADNLNLKNEESEDLKILLQKEKEISASAKVYKNWAISLAAVFILWTILKNVLMIYFPLTKFRI